MHGAVAPCVCSATAGEARCGRREAIGHAQRRPCGFAMRMTVGVESPAAGTLVMPDESSTASHRSSGDQTTELFRFPLAMRRNVGVPSASRT